MIRYSVLTYIFGEYEIVHEILEKDPNAEYILVTDNPNLTSNTWDILYDPMPDKTLFEKCYTVRFHPFKYVHTSVVIRIDGSMEIRSSLKPIIDEFESKSYDRCFMLHPYRNTIIDEYEEWVRTRGYDKHQANRVMSIMETMGYDLRSKGLIEASFEVIRNNDNNTRMNDLVFGMLLLVGPNGNIERIDQTIVSFVLQKFFPQLNLLLVSEEIVTNGKYIQWYHHRTNIPIHTRPDTIKPYLFNKPCKTWI